MVFQIPIIFSRTVRDNIAFGMRLLCNKIDIKELAEEAAIPGNLLDADASQLSIGENPKLKLILLLMRSQALRLPPA